MNAKWLPMLLWLIISLLPCLGQLIYWFLAKDITDKVIVKPINDYQAPHAGYGPIFGLEPMAKSAPWVMSKPEAFVKSNLVNERGALLYVKLQTLKRVSH